MHLHFVQWLMAVLNLSLVSASDALHHLQWKKDRAINEFKIFLDVKGDAKDDYKFVVQLYNPSDITKGTENIDKEQGSI